MNGINGDETRTGNKPNKGRQETPREHTMTDRPPPGRRVSRAVTVLPGRGGGRPGGRCRTGYWRDLQGGSGDSGGHGGSGSSVALALGPGHQAEDIWPPQKKILGKFPSGSRSGVAGSGGRSGGAGSGGRSGGAGT